MSPKVDTALEVWALILVNFSGFILGTIITGLSYHAYRSNNHKTSLRNVTVGFALLTTGIAVEPVYQLGIEGTHVLASEQNISLQIIEGTLISAGFLVLFLSIYKYNARSRRATVTVNGVDDDLFDQSN